MARFQIDLTDDQRATIARAMNDNREARAIRSVRAGESRLSRIVAQQATPGAIPAALVDREFQYARIIDQWHAAILPLYDNTKPPPPPPPPLPTQLGPFNTGNIVFDGGVPVGGWSQLTLYQNGAYNFVGNFHDSGFWSYNDALVWAIQSASGVVYTFTHSGHMAGTIEPGSRDDGWDNSGTSGAIAGGWTDLAAGLRWRWEAAVNWDLGSVINDIKAAIQAVQAIAAIVAIV